MRKGKSAAKVLAHYVHEVKRAEGSMKTLENVEELAIYASACCNEEVLFERNDWFSFCPACERLCFWLYVEPVVSWIELQEQELFTA